MNYSAYLRSPHWRDVRRRFWEINPRRCALCLRDDVPLELHHKTYKRIGREKLSDLLALCRQCHEDTHARPKQRRRRRR